MENNPYDSIYSYITSQETAFKQPITLPGNWNWTMKEHIELSYLYNNSQLSTGKDEFKPVKNITRPILNLQHRTEDIDLKDVQLYVNDPSKFHISFLLKKYHDDVFVVENDLDTFFDELNVQRIDYGGGLSKSTSKFREVVDLHSIAFCDQTDILSGPIGIKHFFSPSQLQEMAKAGWGNRENGATATIEETITLARQSKTEAGEQRSNNTPGKYVEVYEVHGDFPRRFIEPDYQGEEFTYQMHIIAFYTGKNNKKEWITLYHAEEKENPFMLVKRDPVYGRALGFGGAEELFEAQVWTNYDMIRINDMLDAASKTIMITQDKQLAQRHPGGLKDLDNMEFLYEDPNANTRQLDTFPRNLALFENSIAKWQEHAKEMGASQDPLTGKESPSGTPFAALQAQIQQGLGLHEYRRGQYAKHIELIYTKDFIKKMMRELSSGTKFLSELTMDEMEFVAEGVANNLTNKRIVNAILDGKFPTNDERDAIKSVIKEEFKKGGNKKFLEILKGELKDAEIKVKVNVAGKQKNLPQMVDKIVNIFRFIIANPQGFAQLMQVPALQKAFAEILEYSGMSVANFQGLEKLLPPAQPSQLPAQPELTNA